MKVYVVIAKMSYPVIAGVQDTHKVIGTFRTEADATNAEKDFTSEFRADTDNKYLDAWTEISEVTLDEYKYNGFGAY